MIPVFAYLLNGGLYIRDKVFIPFLPLLVLSDWLFIWKSVEKRELSFIAGMIPYIITTIFVYMARNQFVSKGIEENVYGKSLLAESILFLICYVLYCADEEPLQRDERDSDAGTAVGAMSGGHDEYFLSDGAGPVCQSKTVPGCCRRT